MATQQYQVRDLEWIRGTTPPLAFEFNIKRTMNDGSIVREALVFDDARFTVWKGRKGGELLFRYSIVSGEITLVNPNTGRIEFVIDANDTRALQETQRGEVGKNRYELELRNGTRERVYLMGLIAGIGGINDDEEAAGGIG